MQMTTQVDLTVVLAESGSTGQEDRDGRMERLKTRSTPTNIAETKDNDEDTSVMDLELYKAAKQGDVDAFINVLEQVVNEKGITLASIFNQVSPIGNTYLHIAAKFGNVEMIGFIGHHFQPLITKKDFNGDTPLHLAARTGHRKTVKKLLEFQKDICHSSEEPSLLRMKNDKGNIALHEALLNYRASAASDLIEKDPGGAFCLNNFCESPLSLSAKAGYKDCVSLILSKPDEVEKIIDQVKAGKAGKSPIHEAIRGRKRVTLEVMLSKEARFMHFIDEEGRFPLHYAAHKGYMDGVSYLLDKFPVCAIQKDKNGLLPIHRASAKGKTAIIEKLLPHCPDVDQLLDKNGRNVLHFIAENGQSRGISHFLGVPKLEGIEDLVNMKDKEGNTPCHLAAMNFHYHTINKLIWNDKVKRNILNDKGMTALDVAEELSGDAPSWRQMLTWASLRAARVPRVHCPKMINNIDNRNTIPTTSKDKNEGKKYHDMVNTLLLVSTLIATITFAAGFTMPGGYNSSDDPRHKGRATLVGQKKFQVFILCNTIALYCSITAVVFLVRAQLGSIRLVRTALRYALPLLGIALGMMSLAFMAGVTVAISQAKWLHKFLVVMGVTFSSIVSAIFLPLCFPSYSRFSHPFRIGFYNPVTLSVQFEDLHWTAEKRAKMLD